MAERRMFAKSITNSARFLRMPATSRLLYYDLGMAADDDGVAEAFTVMRTTGSNEDDLKVLTAKGFVQILNDDLVCHICDWKQNNLIRADRYHESMYSDLLTIPESVPDGLPAVNQGFTEVRLGKESIEEEREEESEGHTAPTHFPPSVEDVTSYEQSMNYPVEAERFCNYYGAKGWMMGSTKMKDWKAAVRSWHTNRIAKAEPKPIQYRERADNSWDGFDDNHPDKYDLERYLKKRYDYVINYPVSDKAWTLLHTLERYGWKDRDGNEITMDNWEDAVQCYIMRDGDILE